MGMTQSLKDARRIAYASCTHAYPHILIYGQKSKWNGKLYNVETEYVVEFNTLAYKNIGKKFVTFYTRHEDIRGLNGKRIYPNGDFYSDKAKPVKKTRPYKRLSARFESGEIGPYELLMGIEKRKH